jgi:hypothetical protein
MTSCRARNWLRLELRMNVGLGQCVPPLPPSSRGANAIGISPLTEQRVHALDDFDCDPLRLLRACAPSKTMTNMTILTFPVGA